jgi:hypothetical protein
MIHLLSTRATKQQLAEMLEEFKVQIKVAVDVQRGVLAGGGELHAECELALLNDESQQKDIWGADWLPLRHEVRCESLINLRPGQNRSMVILDPVLCSRIDKIVRDFLEGV